MKHTLSLIFLGFTWFNATAQLPYLNIEWEQIQIPEEDYTILENQAGIGVQTYRIYASIPENFELQIMYGDFTSPMRLNADSGFYQNPFGAPTLPGINPDLFSLDPALAYDSWLSIGSLSYNFPDFYILPGIFIFDSFESGGNLQFNGLAGESIFLTTTGYIPENSPDANGRVLIGQLTSSGPINGCINFQIRRLNSDGTIYDPPGPEIAETTLFSNVCFSIEPAPGPCYNDFDDNGTVGVSDLLVLLAAMGCTGDCPIDINNDGNTWLDELFFFLAAYREDCP
jgi:hypothetical protein